MAETYKGFEAYSWVAMIAPAKTPPEMIGKLAVSVNATLRDPAIAKVLADSGFEVIAGDSAQANKLIRDEAARWGRLIRDRHIATD